MYGGQLPDLTNVIFTNGDIDPWHSLSVLENLNAFSPAIVIKGNCTVDWKLHYKKSVFELCFSYDAREKKQHDFLGSSHCRDIYSDKATDLEDLKKARARIRDIISKWISL